MISKTLPKCKKPCNFFFIFIYQRRNILFILSKAFPLTHPSIYLTLYCLWCCHANHIPTQVIAGPTRPPFKPQLIPGLERCLSLHFTFSYQKVKFLVFPFQSVAAIEIVNRFVNTLKSIHKTTQVQVKTRPY